MIVDTHTHVVAPDRDVYFWRGAHYWGMGSQLPSTFELDDAGREIALETSRPYRVHEQVCAVFADESFGAETPSEAFATEPDAFSPW